MSIGTDRDHPSYDHPTIAGVEIPTDEYGRVSLNALHRASGAGESKEPNKWLRGRQAQELIGELFQPTDLSAGYFPVHTVNGGNSPGTYAHPDLAISYAGWISPRFQLQVNRTFRQYQEGTLPARPEPAPQPELPKYEATRSLDEYLELAGFLGLEPGP